MYCKIKPSILLSAILFILIAFPAWYVNIGIMLRVSILLSVPLLVCYITFFKKDCLKILHKIYKNNNVKILILFLLWVVCSGFILVLDNRYNLPVYLSNILLRLFPLIVFPFFVGYAFSLNNNNSRVIKFYYCFILFMIIGGIIDLIFSLFHSDLFLRVFVSNRFLRNTIQSKALFLGIPRIQSFFDEPSYFARFICTHLPFIYCFSNARLFKKIYINKFVLFTTPLLSWGLLIGTMSPIYLVIAIIETLIFLGYKHLKKVTTLKGSIFIIIITLALWIICLGYNSIDFSETFIQRIRDTLTHLTSFEDFIKAEPSLANRIINYINMFIIFKKNALYGVGFGNIVQILHHQFLSSPVPLTAEIIRWITTPDNNTINYAIFWNILAETGLIGFLSLYTFFISCIINLRKLYIKKYCNFVKSLYYTIILIVILTLYDSNLTDCFIWGVLGISLGIIDKYNKYRLLRKCRKDIFSEKSNS